MYGFKKQTFIFVKMPNDEFVGCEVLIRKGLYNCGLILNMFYNNFEKAYTLVNKGKLYSIGFKPDCEFVGSYEELQLLLNKEAAYNINYFNCSTVAFHENLGKRLEAITVPSLESFISDSTTVFIFEDNSWVCYYPFLPNEKIYLNKLFADEGCYSYFYEKDIYVAPEWNLIQSKKKVYKDLYNIDIKCQYQLASKISYQDAVWGNRLGCKLLQPHQIPFKIERDKDNCVDYYIAVNKKFEAYHVTKQWVKNNIEDIANAKIEGSRIVFSFLK